LLILPALNGGLGAAAFNFNGGTLQASSGFSTNLPVTLGTSGGGATFDTAGYNLTLSGSLSGPGSLTKVNSRRRSKPALVTIYWNEGTGLGTAPSTPLSRHFSPTTITAV